MAKNDKNRSKGNSVRLGPLRHPKNEETAPEESPQQGIGSYQMERFYRIITEELDRHEIDDPDEASAYLREHFTGRPIEEILESHAMTPAEEAIELTRQTITAETPEEVQKLCLEALKLDDRCIEARCKICALLSKSEEEYLLSLKGVILKHERQWGAKYMEENKGHFWALWETRAYMRVRYALLGGLELKGFLELAALEGREMLELNPKDNLGVRDRLRGIYLCLQYLPELRELNKTYKEAGTVVADWSKVMALFLEGAKRKAEAAARKAHKANPYTVAYLSGRKDLPDELPDACVIGSEEEAIVGADILEVACKTHGEFCAWLRGLKGLKAPR